MTEEPGFRPDDPADDGAATSSPAGGRHAAPGRATSNSGGGAVRTVIRGIGQALITLGVVVLLFVVYEVYITDIFGEQKQAAATEALDAQWAGSATGGGTAVTTVVQTAGATALVDASKQATDPAKRKKNYNTTLGEGFAKIYVPAFGADYVFTIVEGTDPDDLYVGPGHYADTQFPGQQGNFAVAGHRVSKGSPFNDLGLLASCDSLVIETQDDWFVYRVLPMQDEVATWTTTKRDHCAGVNVQEGQYAQAFGRTIVDPGDYQVVLPVPGVDSLAVPKNAERLITLTTCHPQFSDAQRMIIHGVLVKSYAKAAGFVPPELKETS
jgi:LPXTG-site transpeptidase (sortase) family protein